jgi:hypothetical protein
MRHTDIKTTQRYLSLQTEDLLNEHIKASPLDHITKMAHAPEDAIDSPTPTPV